MSSYITVRGVLCVAHVDDWPDGSRRAHGHTYEVWARFPIGLGPHVDARRLQARLAEVLEEWDHGVTNVTHSEDLAMLIGDRLDKDGCDHVRLERRPEGIIAEWWA